MTTPHPIKIVVSNSRRTTLSLPRSPLVASTRSRSTNRKDRDVKAWPQRRLRINRILSPMRLGIAGRDMPSTGSSSPSTQEEVLTPKSRSIERGFEKFFVKMPSLPLKQRPKTKARKLQQPSRSISNAKSHNSLAPALPRSKSPVFCFGAEDLVEKICTSRIKRLQVQQQMQDNANQKLEQFTQIVNEVKNTFGLKTVTEDIRPTGKHNLFDQYLNSGELLQYLRSL